MVFYSRLKNLTSDDIPSLLAMIWCSLLVFFPRYGVILFSIAALWALYALVREWRSIPVTQSRILALQNSMKTMMSGRNRLEWVLNIGLVVIGILDYFRPYQNSAIEIRMTFLLLGGMVWWHAAHRLVSLEVIRHRFFLGCLFAIITVSIECILGNPWINHINREAASQYTILALTFSIVFLPAMLGQSKTTIGIFIPCVLIACFYFLDCDTAVLGILLTILGYYLGGVVAKTFWRTIQIVCVAATLTMPFIFNTFIDSEKIIELNKVIPIFSYIHRMHIGSYVSKKIIERPWLGYGLGSSTATDVGGVNLAFDFTKDGKTKHRTFEKTMLHPHNMILQWWLEWGAIGALWWAGVLVAIIERIRGLHQANRRIAFAFFAANMTVASFSIGFWQTWWWATWLFLLPLLKRPVEAKIN